MISVQTEATWPEGMKGMTNGMVPILSSGKIVPKRPYPANLVQTEMTWPEGMKGMTNGMVIISCEKGNSSS